MTDRVAGDRRGVAVLRRIRGPKRRRAPSPKKRRNVRASSPLPKLKLRAEEEAKLTKTGSRRQAPKIVIVASMALAFGLGEVTQSVAGCGGYCEAQQVRAICHQAVASQDLKAHQRDAEFEKCKSAPVGYLAPSVRSGAQVGLD
jgi:hypothetical protein